MDSVVYSRLRTSFLRSLVEENYQLPELVDLYSISYGNNDIYLVVTNDGKYILRVALVQRYWDFEPSYYQTEVEFLNFIKDHNVAHHPIQMKNGNYIGELELPEGTRYYSVFSFAKGQPLRNLDGDRTREMGRLLAELHQWMDEFASKHSADRFEYTLEGMYHRALEKYREFGIDDEDYNFLASLEEVLLPPIHAIPKNEQTFGLIHGDYHSRNMHYDQSFTIFDFDFMGYGWRMFDLAAFSSATRFFGVETVENFQDIFVEGYNEVGELTEVELASWPYFEILRGVYAMAEWINVEEIFVGTQLRQQIGYGIKVLREWTGDL